MTQPSIEDLSVSIVVYRPDTDELRRTISSLQTAITTARARRKQFTARLYLVDNGGMPDLSASIELLRRCNTSCVALGGHGNVGYGRGHNIAISEAASRYHLVLNPDIDLDSEALARAFDFIDCHPEVGLLTPRVGGEDGRIQYLCRRYPTLLDLFVRGFLPDSFHRLFANRLARYEMHNVINEHDVVWDPPIVSGCFMLFRTDILKKLNGFDSRYFLYFEDYDLSLRTHELARVAYVPSMRVIHHGGGAARKGGAHIKMFMASAFRFFNRFGWKWR